MKLKNKYPVIILLFLIGTVGCATTAKVRLSEDLVMNKYNTIRKIVIEEAANNGFPTLRSEVKPLEINKWKGKLYFTVKTAYGHDNLTVKFKRKGDTFVVDMVGAATQANHKGAVEAIKAKLSELQEGS